MARPSGLTGQAPTLSDKEFNRLIATIKGNTSNKHATRNSTILHISFLLGLRAKEIATLKLNDVYDDDGNVKPVLMLLAARTKGNKHRDVPIASARLIKQLKDYYQNLLNLMLPINPNSPMFRSQKGSYFSPNSMQQLIKRLFVDAGFEDASSHTGRRSMITKLADSGIDLKSISILAGHSNINTTARYVDASPNKLAKIMGTL